MSPLTNHQQAVRTCNDTHCKQCLVCTETNFETARGGKWKMNAPSRLTELYQALYLQQLKNKIAKAR